MVDLKKYFTPHLILKLFWLWPPYLFCGISVDYFNDSLTKVTMKLRTNFWNQNYNGTHFGGSLFSMTDPIFALMFYHHLGHDYMIWDKASSITFKKAVNEPVYAIFELDEKRIEGIRIAADEGKPIEPEFEVKIFTKDGLKVATSRKVLHIRKKKYRGEKGSLLDSTNS